MIVLVDWAGVTVGVLTADSQPRGAVSITAMPLYEFRCRTCDETFEVRRPMSEAGAPATCPEGHEGAVRLLSAFASVGASAAPASSATPKPAGGCGGVCGCSH